MVDLGQLEKLNELREKGVLTDDEFQIEKRKILAPDEQVQRKPFTPTILAIATIAVVAVVSIMLFTSRGNVDRPVVLASPSATDEPLQVASAVPSVAAKPEASPEGSYQWAVSPVVIGLNPAFIERKLGAAKEKNSSSWSFEVGGCDVTYLLKGAKIMSLSTDVTSKCQPIVQGIRLTPQTRFSSLMDGSAQLFSSCIYSCGNAADPTIDLMHRGAHINDFIDVYYSGRYSDVTSKAMERWEQAIRRQHGVSDDDYDNIDVEWFSCIANAPADVTTMMKREAVTGVRIGRDLIEHCSS